MDLQERLDNLRERLGAKMPEDVKAQLGKASEEVAATGIMDNVPKVGDLAIDFTLPDGEGKLVNLKELLAEGPVVLSFYRGKW